MIPQTSTARNAFTRKTGKQTHTPARGKTTIEYHPTYDGELVVQICERNGQILWAKVMPSASADRVISLNAWR